MPEPLIQPPQDFPERSYAELLACVAAYAERTGNARVASECRAAWRGVLYRFAACDEQMRALQSGLERENGSFAPEHAYALERELFDVFTNGVAVLESAAYGLFTLGALIRPDAFPLETPTDRRNATVGATLRHYSETFHDDELTRILFWWYNSREYAWWKDTRNLLAQQTVIEGENGSIILNAVAVNGAELTRKRVWLLEVVSQILEAAITFAKAQ